MRKQITFRKFKGFDHLRDYVEMAFDQSIGKLDTSHFADVNIIIGTDHARHKDGRPPQFLCEATLKAKSQKIFVKKLDTDFQSAVRKCMKALSDIIIKKSTARRHKIRRGLAKIDEIIYDPSLSSSFAEV